MTTTPLIKYERARQALIEARNVDEVKEIHNQAVAMQLYAKQAKDTGLIDIATEIKLRAERRAGELLRDMPKNKGGDGRGNKKTHSKKEWVLGKPPTLNDLGISPKESMHWQKLANMPEQQFEEKVEDTKTKARAKTEPKPKAARKTKPIKEKSIKETSPQLAKALEHVQPLIWQGKPVNPRKIGEEIDVSHVIVESAINTARMRLEAFAELLDAAGVKHFIDKGALRINDAIRIQTERLNRQFEQRVRDEVIRRIAAADDATRESNAKLRKENDSLKQALSNQAVFTKSQYRQMLMLAHPDASASPELRSELLQLLTKNEARLAKLN